MQGMIFILMCFELRHIFEHRSKWKGTNWCPSAKYMPIVTSCFNTYKIKVDFNISEELSFSKIVS